MGAGFSSLFEKAKRYERDWLDQQCDKVSDVLGNLSTKDKISVLEQVIDYLHMDLAQEEAVEPL